MTENSAPKPGNDNNLMTTANTIGAQNPGHLLQYFKLLASTATELNPLDIQKLVEQQISVLDHTEIVSVLVESILARKNDHTLERENNRLLGEVGRLKNLVASQEKRINLHEEQNKGVLEVTIDGTILDANNLMVQYSGYSKEELVGNNMRILSSGVHPKEFWANFWKTILSGQTWSGDICNKKKQGSLVWLWTIVTPKMDEAGNIVSFKVIRKDVSTSYVPRPLSNDSVDPLTGLANHMQCLKDFPEEKPRSMALVHINNMFDINSVFGRSTGDKILSLMGKVLRNFALENNVSVYKLEGTDFGIIFHDPITEEEIFEYNRKLNAVEIFDNVGKRIYLSIALGIVLDEPNIEKLLRHSYLALRKSKKTRRNVTFNQKGDTIKETAEFFEMQNLVNEAFKEDLFTVFFQEIKENSCAIKKSSTRRFECLVRMYGSKERTRLIPPGMFLSVIKKEGRNQDLTALVIDKVCAFMKENEGHYSINLTEEDLSSYDFAERIHKKLQEWGIDPSRITFEILEEIENIESLNIIKNMQDLRELGFESAIDDFGSGYSNFSRMLSFAPNSLKIDMKYIRDIHQNSTHQSLVRAIVGLAHDNGMMVVAEGVETPAEQEVLEELGVDRSQGYLFSKPSPDISKIISE